MNVTRKIKHMFRYLKNNGIKKSFKRVKEKIQEKLFKSQELKQEQESYLSWIQNNEPTAEELEKQKTVTFEYTPKISVLVPMYETPEKYFKELVESLQSQTYSNWELCLADGSKQKASFIDSVIADDNRIVYQLLSENKGISGNTNAAIAMATGEYMALLDHDDIIPPFSLFEIVTAINKDKEAEFFYSDEDKLMEDKDKRMGPHFKSDFAPDTLRSYNYICHFSVFKKSLMDKLGGFRKEFDGSQDYDIILRATETANRVVHIPKILYHWRINMNSVAYSSEAKPYAYEAAKRAILASLERQHIQGDISDSRVKGLYRLQYPVQGNPKVSIIILNKDHIKDLKKCIRSILNKTEYDNYEVIIVENNSQEKKTFAYYETLKEQSKIKVITYPEQGFNFSALNNFGVKHASGSYFVFLNNDIEILTKGWLKCMLGTVQRKDVGMVGSKLIYPDGSIQHAGVVLNFTGIAGHVNAHLKSYDIGYMGRVMIQQNFNAVTGAMAMISKDDFMAVGGFDEQFAVAYNDIDLCLKVRALGKVIVYDPYIEAYHYESKTRGYEDTDEKKQRLQKETDLLKQKWKETFQMPDGYFNINFRQDVPAMKVNPNKIEVK